MQAVTSCTDTETDKHKHESLSADWNVWSHGDAVTPPLQTDGCLCLPVPAHCSFQCYDGAATPWPHKKKSRCRWALWYVRHRTGAHRRAGWKRKVICLRLWHTGLKSTMRASFVSPRRFTGSAGRCVSVKTRFSAGSHFSPHKPERDQMRVGNYSTRLWCLENVSGSGLRH